MSRASRKQVRDTFGGGKVDRDGGPGREQQNSEAAQTATPRVHVLAAPRGGPPDNLGGGYPHKDRSTAAHPACSRGCQGKTQAPPPARPSRQDPHPSRYTPSTTCRTPSVCRSYPTATLSSPPPMATNVPTGCLCVSANHALHKATLWDENPPEAARAVWEQTQTTAMDGRWGARPVGGPFCG